MIPGVKEILIKKLDEFLDEVHSLADGEFAIGNKTSYFFANAIEIIWNAMAYSAKLEAQLLVESIVESDIEKPDIIPNDLELDA